MQIVIDISEEDYAETMYKKQHSPLEMDWADRVIANGTPLPKGHGRLIDLDDLYDLDRRKVEYAPTVIEADKAESETHDADNRS